MFKKTFALMTSLVFVVGLSGLVLAQNSATVTQTSPDNDADVTQTSTGPGPQNVTVLQGAGTSNYADVDQTGYGNTVGVNQTAGTTNDADIDQAALNDQISVSQTAGTYNDAAVEQTSSSASTSTITATQTASTSNDLEIHQLYGGGDRKWITLLQAASAGLNDAFIVQDCGKQTEMTINQSTTSGDNYAYTEQYGYAWDSRTEVYQSAALNNELVILEQLGGAGDYTWMGLDQLAPSGSNDADISNTGYTGGPALLTDAGSDGSVSGYGTYATQVAGGDNHLDWDLDSGGNTFGLNQNAYSDNDADVMQTGGGNSLGAYQSSPNSYNVLDVTQYGNVTATVSQSSSGSYNDCYLSQSYGSSAIVTQTATSGPNTVSIIQ